jgi:hypothetical protein
MATQIYVHDIDLHSAVYRKRKLMSHLNIASVELIHYVSVKPNARTSQI